MSSEEEAENVEDAGEEPASEEEEPETEDPQEVLRDECRPKCERFFNELEACNERVNSKSQTQEVCFQELIDLLHCVEHCVAEKLFLMLK